MIKQVKVVDRLFRIVDLLYVHLPMQLFYDDYSASIFIITTECQEMFLPLVTQKALIQSVAASPPPLDAFFVAAITRGGAAVAAATFDMGLAKTRLEGLAYGTVTALV